VCPHRQGSLSEGSLEAGKVLCPWHGWAFDLETGKADHAPAQSIRLYPLEISGEVALITL
jgi:nitrite reductase (NADH) small subunit